MLWHARYAQNSYFPKKKKKCWLIQTFEMEEILFSTNVSKNATCWNDTLSWIWTNNSLKTSERQNCSKNQLKN